MLEDSLARTTSLVALILSCATAGCAGHARQPDTQPERPEQSAQPAHPAAADPRIGAEAARADLEFLYRALRSAHYDLFVHRPQAEYDAYFRQIEARLNRPMSSLDLAREFQPFVAFGRIGHARIEFPIAEYIAAAQQGGTILPFDVRVEGDRTFITHSYLQDSRIRPGAELLAFDDRPAREVIAEVSRFVSGERPYMVNAQLERFFPRWFWVARGSVPQLRISGRTADGAPFAETVHGLPIGEAEPLKSEWTEELSTREVRLLDDRIAYLRPGAFYNIEGGESMEVSPFRSFIDEAFGRIIAAESQSLIIDVRDNPGGDNSFSDLMVAWFASRPFRFSDAFSIKASAEIRQQFRKQVEGSADEDDIVSQMYQAIKDEPDGMIVPITLPLVPPRPDRFTGQVFLLVNRHSYSNAASLAGMLQDYGFARIIGEETGDLPTSYASSAQFTLPNSGLVVTYPKGYFIRPNGDETVRGVVPDFPIAPEVFLEGHDAVLRAAVEIAGQRRP